MSNLIGHWIEHAHYLSNVARVIVCNADLFALVSRGTVLFVGTEHGMRSYLSTLGNLISY